ncbi:MAG: hypothetical protein IJ640_09790 [Prevotella sp.]|jgi:hypothetical protein|nr:hypothetical protein [Prevotella sp.]MBR1526930.1 hypothetical protein [Prevotella sp.]MDY6230621.1 hypothetical protein [Prevotella sp.]
MNLYIRYFEKEALVSSVDEAIDFLTDIPEIEMTNELADDIKDYAESNIFYPKRYKVRPRVYFIIIKTEAATMTDFKQKKALRTNAKNEHAEAISPVITRLNEEKFGWYEGSLNFKRVVLIPATGKFEYRDTHFVAQCKANSGIDCYNRIVDYLNQRVDSRSQFPSAKGKNFRFQFLGYCK